MPPSTANQPHPSGEMCPEAAAAGRLRIGAGLEGARTGRTSSAAVLTDARPLVDAAVTGRGKCRNQRDPGGHGGSPPIPGSTARRLPASGVRCWPGDRADFRCTSAAFARYMAASACSSTSSRSVSTGTVTHPIDAHGDPLAAVTVLGALETFFNWRSRWVLMEETQYRLNRLRDEMDYYLVVTPQASMRREDLDRFFQEQQLVWSDVSRR
jgi:hypothetical protein